MKKWTGTGFAGSLRAPENREIERSLIVAVNGAPTITDLRDRTNCFLCVHGQTGGRITSWLLKRSSALPRTNPVEWQVVGLEPARTATLTKQTELLMQMVTI